MSTLPPDQNQPIPGETGKERGCKSFWGLAPTEGDIESARGPIEKKIREYVCGTQLACSAWVDAFEDKNDQPLVVQGTVDHSWVSGSDLPFNHSSHDWVFNIDLDDQYLRYHSDKNKKSAAGRWLMHIEWELNALRDAYAYLPAAGDRVWVAGRWVFDCGHPENCKTEIHPPEAIISWRPEPFIDTSSGDPIEGVHARIIVSGHGGVCCHTEIAKKDHRYAVPVPAQPDSNADLIVNITSNGPDPEVVMMLDGSEPQLEIVLPFRAGDELPVEAYLANVRFGWRQTSSSQDWRLVVVRLESLTVFNTHDISPDKPGDWNLWVEINGTWNQVLHNQRVTTDQPVNLHAKEFSLTLPRPAEPGKPALFIQSTGWEGDRIDEICMFDETPTATRRFPDFPDLDIDIDIEQAFKWMLRQAGKIQNERLGDLHATHSWDELADGGSFIKESDHPGEPDFALHYSIHPR